MNTFRRDFIARKLPPAADDLNNAKHSCLTMTTSISNRGNQPTNDRLSFLVRIDDATRDHPTQPPPSFMFDNVPPKQFSHESRVLLFEKLTLRTFISCPEANTRGRCADLVRVFIRHGRCINIHAASFRSPFARDIV